MAGHWRLTVPLCTDVGTNLWTGTIHEHAVLSIVGTACFTGRGCGCGHVSAGQRGCGVCLPVRDVYGSVNKGRWAARGVGHHRNTWRDASIR